MARFIKSIFLLGAAMVVLTAAQQRTQRLILKDGSYQTVTKWEIKGDRVRYFSAERYAWEELPNSLVDWPATEKYNKEQQQRPPAPVELKEEPPEEPDVSLVAPGLHLPDGGGVFLLDVYQNQPQLLELAQSGSELNRHMGRNILRAAINPVALSSRQTIELKGEHAKVQSHVSQPAIYVDVDPGGSPAPPTGTAGKGKATSQPQYGIVRLQKKKDLRVVGNLNVAIYGKVSQKENWIKTSATPVGDWVKVAPDSPLDPGEYAVVELLEKGQINLFVWDFGVDPTAPPNKNAWTPRRPAAGKGDNGQTPGLEKRPK
jgi:hypothetical protein